MTSRWTEAEDAKLRECREQGMGYKEIAETVLPNRTLESCKSRGKRFADGTSDGRFTTKQERVFKEEFEAKFPKFEYLKGYTNTDEPFLMRCKKCGHIQERNAQCLRRNKSIGCYGCVEAKKMERKKEAEERKQARIEEKRLAEIERNKPHNLTCNNCGEPFKSKRKKLYCSNKCMNKYNYARKTLRRRKWAERNGIVEWDITVDKLVKLYENTCYLCGGECDSQDYERRDDGTFIAGGSYPSIEHVIPLSKGGTHTWDNVRLAHLHCNIIKSDKQIGANNEQLELPV